MSGTTSYDLTQLIGFNFNGIESDQVDIANASDGDPANVDYVPGSTTYNVTANDYAGNQSDVGFGPNNVEEQVIAATNGVSLDGTPLANPLALGQIEVLNTDNGFVSPPLTFDVLGFSNDGSTILVGLTSQYAGAGAADPYGGQTYVFANQAEDTASLTAPYTPPALTTFTTTNAYTGGPFFDTSTAALPGNPTLTNVGTNADVVSVSNALVGKLIPSNKIITTTSQTGVTQSGVTAETAKGDGGYILHYTQSALGAGAATFTLAAGASAGPEGQPTLKLGSVFFFQVVGFNSTQILLNVTSSTGIPTTRYDVLSITNDPPQLSTFDLNTAFQNYGPAPIAGQAYPCFMAGTRIATPTGEVAVETLKTGDLVLTVDGEARPVRWLGRSTVSKLFIDPVRNMPVRILAGALGENLPTRDLLVSPDHAMFIGGFLVQAGALVNGTTIVRESNVADVFTYYHLELDAHCLVLAEGAATETFVDNIDRMAFDNWNEHPEAEGAEMAEMPYARAKSARQVPGVVRAIIGERVIAVLGKNAVAA